MWIGFDTYEYSCDGGSLMLGNKDFQVDFPNDYGDGRHSVYVGTIGRTVPDTFHGDRVKFVGSIEGEFNVYSYDCLNGDELVDFILEEAGCLAFDERWNDLAPVQTLIDDVCDDYLKDRMT